MIGEILLIQKSLGLKVVASGVLGTGILHGVLQIQTKELL